MIFGCDMVEIETHDFWSCPIKVWYDQKNAAWKAGDCELCFIGEEHIMVVGNVCEMEDDDEPAEKEREKFNNEQSDEGWMRERVPDERKSSRRALRRN